jgi:hypothetical protein
MVNGNYELQLRPRVKLPGQIFYLLLPASSFQIIDMVSSFKKFADIRFPPLYENSKFSYTIEMISPKMGANVTIKPLIYPVHGRESYICSYLILKMSDNYII